MSANGVNGKIAKGEVPLTLGRRLLNYIIGVAIMISGAIIGDLIGYYSSDEAMIWVGLIVGLVIMAVSFVVTRTAFKMQLEKGEKMKKLKKKEDK